MTHTCPACGKQWKCSCAPEVIAGHVMGELQGHWQEIACSLECAEHLNALLRFLRRYGL